MNGGNTMTTRMAVMTERTKLFLMVRTLLMFNLLSNGDVYALVTTDDFDGGRRLLRSGRRCRLGGRRGRDATHGCRRVPRLLNVAEQYAWTNARGLGGLGIVRFAQRELNLSFGASERQQIGIHRRDQHSDSR